MIINVIKYANMGLSFLVELCLLAAFAYWGAHTGQELAAKIGLGVGAPLLGAIFWGVFMSPRAPVPVHNPLHLIVKVVLFGLAVVALIVAGRSGLAWVLGAAFVINSLLDFL